MAGFVLLRVTNLYGDPHAWSAAGGPVRAVLSFLDCEKYPPSLLFLAMTLGPALCVLAWMDRPLGPWAARIAVYGRVPLFYYVHHTEADTLDKLRPEDLRRNAAAIALLAYVLAER